MLFLGYFDLQVTSSVMCQSDLVEESEEGSKWYGQWMVDGYLVTW